MPLTYERTFRVRHYECDVYGHLNNTYYLRYMQEAAFDASAVAGYDMARYREMGRIWLVRQTGIEYIQPLVYGDSAKVRTWVEDFRRVDSRRSYEIWKSDPETLVARAYTDWVYLDRANGCPATIPDRLVEAFFPEGYPGRGRRRKKIPPAPPPPSGVFRTQRRVEWRDIDPNGHVNNATYLAYAEDCGVQVAAAFGWPMERCTQAGFGIIVRRHEIEYHRQARLDDVIEMTTWVSDFRHASGIRHYFLRDASSGEMIARLRSQYAWVSLDTMKLIRIPEEFRESFKDNVI